jgi:hypothetical protein
MVGAFAVLLAIVGTPIDRHAAPGVSPTSATASEPSVAAHGFALASASVELPDDTGTYPDGPHADAVNANCTACHSASMALTQPALSADQWKAEVTKMREVYKAPVSETAVPDIIAYLTSMPAQKAAPATGKAQDPDPKAAPDVSGSTG